MHIEKPEGIDLSNTGKLELYFIGTGSAFTKTRNQNNLLIIKGGHHLLVDCGTRCTQALYDAGITLASVRNFLITHSHADHIGGLEEVQLFNRYVLGKKPGMVINEEYASIIWNQSLRGGSEQSESIPLSFADLWQEIRPMERKDMPRETWEATVGNINVKLPRTMHFPDSATSWEDSAWSCAVIIDDRVLFTSDTRYDPALLMDYDSLMDFEIIFHDCQLFTGGIHASLDELSALPPNLKSKIILMHYGDNWLDFRQQALDSGFHSWAKQGHSYIFE
ncbi:MAG: MBL fold metallo-hydrolase [Gammaproteobacteria bacterium]|nr:MBL fold metallo-hydrolase [Gammaproteobacteria bacterium]